MEQGVCCELWDRSGHMVGKWITAPAPAAGKAMKIAETLRAAEDTRRQRLVARV